MGPSLVFELYGNPGSTAYLVVTPGPIKSCDAESGAGLELGGGVAFTDAASGLSIEARARMLLAHADSDYEEWGASATARLDPGARGRGLAFSLAPAIGATSSAAGRLWGAHDARGLAPDAEFEASRGLQAEAGYGLALFGDRFTGTPNLGFGLSDGGARDWRVGWRLTFAVRGDPGFEVHLDAVRREAANEAEPEHTLMLRSRIFWCGATFGDRAWGAPSPPPCTRTMSGWRSLTRSSALQMELTLPASSPPATATRVPSGRYASFARCSRARRKSRVSMAAAVGELCCASSLCCTSYIVEVHDEVDVECTGSCPSWCRDFAGTHPQCRHRPDGRSEAEDPRLCGLTVRGRVARCPCTAEGVWLGEDVGGTTQEEGSPPDRAAQARRRDRGRRRRGGPRCGAGPVASVHGAAVPARRMHGLLHQGGPGRTSGSGAHGRFARNRVQYRVIRQICLRMRDCTYTTKGVSTWP